MSPEQRLAFIYDRVQRIRSVLATIKGGLVEVMLDDIEQFSAPLQPMDHDEEARDAG